MLRYHARMPPPSKLPPAWAFVDHEILPAEQARIPLEDRGFLFAESAYEVVLCRNGCLLDWDRHRARFARSIEGVGLDVDRLLVSTDEAVQALTAKNEPGFTALLYLQATGGSGPRDHLPQRPPAPALYGTLRHLPYGRVDSIPGSGCAVITLADFRWQRATWKTTQLLGAIQAKKLARESGADEAIFINTDGLVLEACSMNLLLVREGRVLTPPLSLNLLPGVTRDVILNELDVGASEALLTADDLRSAEEVFLSSTTRAVLAVTRVDAHPVGDGNVGPVTRRLAELMLLRQTRILGAETSA